MLDSIQKFLDFFIEINKVLFPCDISKEFIDEEVIAYAETLHAPLGDIVNVHSKAFVVGFVSTVFTLMPFVVSYSQRHGMKLDTKRVMIGLSQVGVIGGVAFIFVNGGDPKVDEEYKRVFEFAKPYLPLVTSAIGRGEYDPIFQETVRSSGYTSTPSSTIASGYNYGPSRPSPASPYGYTPRPAHMTEKDGTLLTSSSERKVSARYPFLGSTSEATKVLNSEGEERTLRYTTKEFMHPVQYQSCTVISRLGYGNVTDVINCEIRPTGESEPVVDRESVYDFDTP